MPGQWIVSLKIFQISTYPYFWVASINRKVSTIIRYSLWRLGQGVPVLSASIFAVVESVYWIWRWLGFHCLLETRHLSRHAWIYFDVYTGWPLFQGVVVVLSCGCLGWGFPLSVCETRNTVHRLQVCHASRNNWPPLRTFPSFTEQAERRSCAKPLLHTSYAHTIYDHSRKRSRCDSVVGRIRPCLLMISLRCEIRFL